MASTTRFFLITFFLHLQSTFSAAQNNSVDSDISCERIVRATEEFDTFNATNVYDFPALKASFDNSGLPISLVVDEDAEEWRLSTRVLENNIDGAMTFSWLNTQQSNMTGIGLCTQELIVDNLGVFLFSEEVLRRSIDDVGDCKKMLGEECVEALVGHYKRSAQYYISNGECLGGLTRNDTIPYQCSGLVDGDEEWLGVISSGNNLTFSYEDIWEQQNCTNEDDGDFKPLAEKFHGLGGYGGWYNSSIRFPKPRFLTFFPNRTDINESESPVITDDNIHVEITCVKPDQFLDDSEVPATGEEILDEGLEYNDKATTPSAGTMVKPFAAYLAVAAGAAVLLV